MRYRIALVTVLNACLVAAGCGNKGSDRVTDVTAVGRVDGATFFDRNGNRIFDTGDTTMSNVRVLLLDQTTGDTAASDLTDTQGVFSLTDVPVGDYSVRVDTTTVGDTAVVALISLTTAKVRPGDSLGLSVAVTYPFVSTAGVRQSPVGRKVFLTGVALNALAAFGDTTVHVADTAGAIRTTRVKQLAILTGDSLRFLGRRNVRNGQPTLDDVTPYPVSIGTLPTAVSITSDEAATADGGALDAELVSVVGMEVSDTMTTSVQDFIATADDGSGPVGVFFSRSGGFVVAGIVPGDTLDITGLLVPKAGGGTWWLKPRSQSDVVIR
jgi:SdrD B-like domain